MTFYASSEPRARKPHRCQTCGRTIRPGETYRRGAGMDGSSAWTFKECVHCTAVVTYVLHLWGVDEYDDDLLPDWDPETIEHMRIKAQWRRRWTRMDGDLYPTPRIEWHTDDSGFPRSLSLHAGEPKERD